MTELEDQEATGKLVRAPKQKKAAVDKSVDAHRLDSKVFTIDEAHAFEMAVSREKMKQTGEPIYITEEFMSYLLRGSSEPSLMYQGVRLYVEGSKDELDAQESMTAEKRAEHLSFLGKSPEEVKAMKKEAQDAR